MKSEVRASSFQLSYFKLRTSDFVLQTSYFRLATSTLFVFRRVVRFARRDVVDIRDHVVRRVDVVEAERASGLLHRNRTARFVFTLLLFLRAAAALRLRVGPEVALASGCA